MASIALFAALSGGYALAFKGSGTLQKGGVFGLADSPDFTTIRVLTGIGRIEARCIQEMAADPTLEVRLHASGTIDSTNGILYRKDHLGGGSEYSGTLAAGENSPAFGVKTDDDLIRLYVGTNEIDDDGSFKRPQASVEIATFQPTGFNGCTSSRVEVLALNTED